MNQQAYLILLGILLWLCSVILIPLNLIETLILFSFFVTVPITFSLTVRYQRTSETDPTFVRIQRLLPFAGISATLSFYVSSEVATFIFALGWVLLTCYIAWYGLKGWLERGFYTLGETCLHIGCLYISIGGLWFIIYQLALPVLDFSPTIIALTAIHFHYSAFVLPIFTGILARQMNANTANQRWFRLMAYGIIIGPIGIAIGITYTHLLEFIFVMIFVLAIWLYTMYAWKHAYQMRNLAKGLLRISALSVWIPMGLSLLYAYGQLTNQMTITIANMTWFHGLTNAIGFVFLGSIGWLLHTPARRSNPYHIPMSHLYGERRIHHDFYERKGLVENHQAYTGLVDDFHLFKRRDFQVNRIHPRIIDFYEHTCAYELHSTTQWSKGFRWFSHLYHRASRTIGQLHLSLHHQPLTVDSRILPVNNEKDGREKVRAWIRTCASTKQTIFVAAYSYHQAHGQTYMNVSLPLPFGQMTGILRLEHWNDSGLHLTSLPKEPQGEQTEKGDAGIYFSTKWLTVRLPLAESFHVWVDQEGNGSMKATHQMWFFGIPFLLIKYNMRRKKLESRAKG